MTTCSSRYPNSARVASRVWSARAGEPVVETNLVRSNLNLWLDRTMVIAMAASADSPRALMVIVSCREPSTPAVLAEE